METNSAESDTVSDDESLSGSSGTTSTDSNQSESPIASPPEVLHNDSPVQEVSYRCLYILQILRKYWRGWLDVRLEEIVVHCNWVTRVLWKGYLLPPQVLNPPLHHPLPLQRPSIHKIQHQLCWSVLNPPLLKCKSPSNNLLNTKYRIIF